MSQSGPFEKKSINVINGIDTFFQKLGFDWHIPLSEYQTDTSEESEYYLTN